MIREVLLITIFFLFFIGTVNGGEINTNHDFDIVIINDYENITYAEEDGHLNTTFSDGSKGYCLEYGEQEAKKNDKFYVKNTSFAKNSKTGEDISRYLKTYFVDYYNETQKNKIVTQHTIWHFTDNFDGWRLNYTLINQIKKNPSTYNDTGVKKWNSTHEMVYKFNVLLPMWTHHQNYWTYDIQFREIMSNETNNNDNLANNTTNTTFNNTTNITDILPSKNITEITTSDKTIQKIQPTRPQNYKTGNNVQLLMFIVMVIALIIINTNYNRK